MQIVNRSRRRMEYKRKLGLPLLVLAVAVASFALGVQIGRGGRHKPAPLPIAAALPESPPAKPAVAPPTTKDLTFYDTLPKGEQAPLGSGINQPREAPPPPEPAAAAPFPPPASAPAAAARPLQETAGAAAAISPPSAPATAAVPGGKGGWIVQVASYKGAEDARKTRERLAGKGFPATVREADLGEKGLWHRVVLGPYPTDTEANRAANALQNEGLSGLVRKD